MTDFSIVRMAVAPTVTAREFQAQQRNAKEAEHRANNHKTAAALGVAVGLPLAAGAVAYKYPDQVGSLVIKNGEKVDKIYNFIKTKGKEIASKLENVIKQNGKKVTAKVDENIANSFTKAKETIIKNRKNFAKDNKIFTKFEAAKNVDKFAEKLKNIPENLKEALKGTKLEGVSKKTIDEIAKNPKETIKKMSKNLAEAAEKLKDTNKVNAKVAETVKKQSDFASKIKAEAVKLFTKAKGTNAYKTVSNAVKDFMSKPTSTKGKYALIAAGVALTLSAIVKLVRHHDYEAGRIDQKYEDMKRNNPIIDAETGEVISRKDYQKMANTYLK